MRRANGTGSITQRKDGRYGFKVTAGGEVIKQGTVKTRAEAEKRIREAISAYDRGEFVHDSTLSVGDWLGIWLRDYAKNTVKPQTYARYGACLRAHVLPALGKVKLQALRVDMVQRLVNEKAAALSPATVKYIVTVLRSALRQAVDNRLIIRDPSAAVKLPRQTQKDVRALSEAEAQALLAVLPANTYGRALRFMLGTGLRVSELCALRWCDIEKDGFRVNQTLYIVEGGGALSEDELRATRQRTSTPKTEAGRRFIPLNDKLRDILAQERAAQNLRRIAAGAAWHDGGFIFASDVGTPKDRHNIARALRGFCQQAGIQSISPHVLRHTFATQWVRNKQDIVTLSKILGHSKVAFTMQTYVHADDESKRDGMAAMAAII